MYKGIFVKKILVILLAIALFVTNISPLSFPVELSQDTGTDEDVVNTGNDSQGDKKISEKAGTKLQETEGLGLIDEEVDYESIIVASKDESYREEVVISQEKFYVIREEDEDTCSIEETQWFKDNNVSDYMVISENDLDGKKKVSYEIIVETDSMWDVIDHVNEDEDILVAEPEYIFYTSEEGTPTEIDNPGMSNQWYLDTLEMESLWSDEEVGNTTGEGVVIAVIDTGVDYTHEDLKDNMWMNAAELSGVEGVDDDGNGYIDDIYGVSFIDGKSDPMDDNGHGTHVAGIIAMSNNQTGGVGLAYNAQIMAIKAGGADGTLSSSDIAKAIYYAANNGADVINMSFGSYGRSAIVEEALASAYSKCVLVAAAGNDSYPTADALEYMFKGNIYPAAYSYVVGVMAHDSASEISEFSNWDYKANYGAEYEIIAPGTAIYSTLPGNRYASWSGTSMATPMVSAAAAILRSQYTDKNEYSSRFIMGQLVSATEDTVTFIDFYNTKRVYSKLNISDSLTKTPKPNINVEEVYIFDSVSISENNNGDGIIQPGEVIDIAVGYRNQWGAATEFYATVHATSGGGVQNPYVTFLNGNEVKLEDIGTFATQNNGYIYDEYGTIIGVENPIRVQISEDAPNDANIAFYINYHAKNGLDSNDTNVYVQREDSVYTLSVQKGKVLSGKISQSMTLTNDEYYIIENSLLIPRGVTVDVEPGTKIQFWSGDSGSVYADTNIAYILVEGKLNFNGTEEEPIELFPGKDYEDYPVKIVRNTNYSSAEINMSYCKIINPIINITNGDHLEITQDYDSLYSRDYNEKGNIEMCDVKALVIAQNMSDSKIKNLRSYSYGTVDIAGKFDTVLFDNCAINFPEYGISYRVGTQYYYESIKTECVNCTFLVNQGEIENPWTGTLSYVTSGLTSVGTRYATPQYTSSSVIEHNGKKYVMYDFDNYWAVNGNLTDNDYKYLVESIKNNGGVIPTLNPEEEWVRGLIKQFYEDLGIESGLSINVMTGVYYDEELGAPTYAFGGEWSLPDGYYSEPNAYYKYLTIYYYNYNGSCWSNTVSSLMDYVLVEYPAEADDYNIANPVFDASLAREELARSNAFRYNAILNRLLETDISNWMKLTSRDSNKYNFLADDNYWGTIDEKLIQKQIVDFDTNISFPDYIISPYLETPAETTYPCVADIYILDKDGNEVTTVGNGTIEVHVLFNRDMDTTILPTVTYGPDNPYTDYLINGSFVNAREWVGTVDIKVLINQGQQYFKVIGGAAADDSWLTIGSDWGRFGFKVEATGAEALTLQGEGLEDEIHLMWTQDDYELLAGYNVYRSETGVEGTYKKINSSIVAATDKEYYDITVKAGKIYYYYFTVVDTGLLESKPSNIIHCASIDNIAPVIKHSALESVTYGINASIVATITDNVAVNSATLYYRMQGDTEYKSVAMGCTSGKSYSAQIPAKDIKVGVLEYYIVAADSMTYGYAGSATEPYAVEAKADAVLLSVAANDLVVGRETTLIINGINLTDELEVYIGEQKVDVTYVSDKELSVTYTPDYMGMKTIEIRTDGDVLSRLKKAFAVKDSSVRVYNEASKVLLMDNYSNSIQLLTNFSGKVESIDIKFSYFTEDFMDTSFIPYDLTRWIDDTQMYEWTEGGYNYTRTASATVNGSYVNNNQLGYLYVYGMLAEIEYVIESVAINGVEVENIAFDNYLIEYIAEEDYVPIESVTFTEDYVAMTTGDTYKLNYQVFPSNATFRDDVTITIQNDYVSLDDGLITANRSGWEYIRIYAGGMTDEMQIYITPIPITDIILDTYRYTGVAGETLTLNATVNPVESDMDIYWYISDGYDHATIKSEGNGRTATVVLMEAGYVTVEVYRENIKRQVLIEIVENEAFVDVEEELLTLLPNQYYNLSYTIKNQVTEGALTAVFSSSNTNVARVDANGKITTVGVGSAVISAKVSGSTIVDSVIVLVGNDSMSYLQGDINMDGKVTATDAMLALKLVGYGQCNDAILKIADVNASAAVTATDAMLILQYATGKIDKFN